MDRPFRQRRADTASPCGKDTVCMARPDEHLDVWLKIVVVNCCRTEMQKMSYHADAPLLDAVTVPGADESLPFVDRLRFGLL